MKGKFICRALLAAYIATTLFLLLLAFLLFKFDLSEKFVQGGITLIYLLSCFLGGFFMGKSTKTQKYLWGTLLGLIYFLILTGVSWIVNRTGAGNMLNLFTTFALCLGSGMLGGMLS